MKKIMSMFLAITLLFMTAMTTTFANQASLPTKQSLTVTKKQNGTVNNNVEFQGYRILDAQPSGSVYTYTVNEDFKDFFGVNEGTTPYGDFKFDKNQGILRKVGNSEDYTLFLPTDTSNEIDKDSPTDIAPTPEMAVFTAQLQSYIQSQKSTNTFAKSLISSIANGTAKTVPVGYYMIKEIAPNSNSPIVASKAMAVNVGKDPKTIYPKDSAASLTKKILEDNKELDANDVQLGDNVNYKITSTIPTYDSSVNWENIMFEYTDELSQGLKLQEGTLNVSLIDPVTNASIVENQLAKEDYLLSDKTGNSDTGTTFKITFNPSGKTKLGKAGDKLLCITYSATLTKGAIVADAKGNPNKITLKYTNNPDITDSYNELTDTVKTYTYKLNLFKFEKEGMTENPLANAEFSIYREVNDAENNTNLLGTMKTDASGNGVFKTTINGEIGNEEIVDLTLDSGTYYIKETKAPSNEYSMLGSIIKLTITGNSINAGDLNGNAKITATDLNGTKIDEVEVKQEEGGSPSLTLKLRVENHKGISLPGTGGIGTKGFLMIGGVLVLIAGGLFIASEIKRKKELDK